MYASSVPSSFPSRSALGCTWQWILSIVWDSARDVRSHVALRRRAPRSLHLSPSPRILLNWFKHDQKGSPHDSATFSRHVHTMSMSPSPWKSAKFALSIWTLNQLSRNTSSISASRCPATLSRYPAILCLAWMILPGTHHSCLLPWISPSSPLSSPSKPPQALCMRKSRSCPPCSCISVQRRCFMSSVSWGRCMGVAVMPASPLLAEPFPPPMFSMYLYERPLPWRCAQ
mmetsp:Transcript_2843/g.7010  ORF Transcript_2843/g.7010 Transcript_2843/m.7010 type:complete len:229 (-) Transcript_2843:1129-1815(-)